MMSEIVLLLLMLLAHIVEDFHLQGKMADMKQKMWWAHMIDDAIEDSDRRNGKKTIKDDSYYTFWDMRYKQFGNDYIPVLILHGFEWAICVSIPVFFYTGFEPSMGYVLMVCVMAAVHSIVDHMKCNEMCINLVVDQAIHMVQIAVLFAMAIA